jgi:uncharacterized membrane protein (DUF373 family)
MITIEDIRRHYFFTDEDERNLKKIGEIVSPYAQQFASDFYEYLTGFPEAAKFFRSPEAIEKRKETIKRWLLMLFDGKYDHHYLVELQHIGHVHVKREVPIHWVTASLNFKREYLIKILEREIEDRGEFQELVKSLEKILDINLDIITSSYHEEEIKKIFLTKKMDSALITFAERFTYGLNLVLVLALIGLSIGVVVLFVKDIYTLFSSGNLEKGILSSLGTLLIIWVMVELMGTEIKYLKGGRFHIEIFVSVALVAIIRELLISTLAHESLQKMGVFLAAILILGVVYYLISRTEFPR